MENITNDAATAAVNISIANEAEFASRVEVNTNKFLRFHEDLTHIQTACQHASENVATIEREAERDDQTLKGLVSSLAVLQEKIVALEGKKAEEETRCEQEEKILQHYRTVLEAMDGIRSISDKETDADAEIRTKATQQLAAAEKRYALLTSVLSQTKGELQQADTESIAIKEQIQRIEARAAELDQLQSSLQALNKNLDIGIKYLTKFEYFLDGWENYRATMSVFTNSDSDADDGRQPSPTAAVSPPAATAGTVAATFGSNNGTPSPAISATSTTPTTESEPATPPATSKAETPTSTTPTTESGPATPPATSKAETATSTTPTIESGPATPPASSKAKAAAPNIKPAPFGHPPRPRIAASATSTTASVPVNTFTNKTTTPNITPVPSTWTARPPAAASVPATSPPSVTTTPNIPVPSGQTVRPPAAASVALTPASVPANSLISVTTTPNIRPVPSRQTVRPPAAASVPANFPTSVITTPKILQRVHTANVDMTELSSSSSVCSGSSNSSVSSGSESEGGWHRNKRKYQSRGGARGGGGVSVRPKRGRPYRR